MKKLGLIVTAAAALALASPASAGPYRGHWGGGWHGEGGHWGGGWHRGGGFWRNGVWVPFAILGGAAALGAGAYYAYPPQCWWVQDPYYGPRQVCQGY
jgi:hypothetical protein